MNVAAQPSTSATTQEARLEELRRVRRQGYAVDREQNEPSTCCVAVPVWAAEVRVMAAISISGATVHITERRQQELLPLSRRTARAVSRDLGGGDRPWLPTPRPADGDVGLAEPAAVSREAFAARRSGGGEP
jgi:hypothetical protein